jgi:hypothetical protein
MGTRISALTSASTPAAADVLPIVQGGTTKKTTVASLSAAVGFAIQIGTDANVTISKNSLVLVPTTTASRTYSLPSSPNDGDFAIVLVTNAYDFSVVVSGNGHNINDGFAAAASTYTIANIGAALWFVYISSTSEWRLI